MAFTESHLDTLDRIMARTIALNIDNGMETEEAASVAFLRMRELTPNTASVWMRRHAG